MCSATGCNLMILEKHRVDVINHLVWNDLKPIYWFTVHLQSCLCSLEYFASFVSLFFIHVCLLIAVGVWIILGSSWTMPGGKPQAAGRYHNVTFSVGFCLPVLWSWSAWYLVILPWSFLVMVYKICTFFIYIFLWSG